MLGLLPDDVVDCRILPFLWLESLKLSLLNRLHRDLLLNNPLREYRRSVVSSLAGADKITGSWQDTEQYWHKVPSFRTGSTCLSSFTVCRACLGVWWFQAVLETGPVSASAKYAAYWRQFWNRATAEGTFTLELRVKGADGEQISISTRFLSGHTLKKIKSQGWVDVRIGVADVPEGGTATLTVSNTEPSPKKGQVFDFAYLLPVPESIDAPPQRLNFADDFVVSVPFFLRG